ncbi:MAG: signal peptidase II [Oscillochloris sp.]|nr:signal peptidase II [Oscillochloris sp.]
MRLDSARWMIPAILALFLLVFDQATKHWAVDQLGPTPGVEMITIGFPWLRFVYTQNTGIAFSLFQGMPTLFTITSIVITAGAIAAYVGYLPNQVRLVQISMGLIFGGAIGNIIDRLRLGYVVDFIAVGWWPVFNLADSGITVGVVLLAGYLIIVGDEPPEPPQAPPRDDILLTELLSRDLHD